MVCACVERQEKRKKSAKEKDILLKKVIRQEILLPMNEKGMPIGEFYIVERCVFWCFGCVEALFLYVAASLQE